MCDSKELLVGFLYDELDPSAKRTFSQHLETCADCRDELAALGATRAHIARWTPPDADLGFRIVRGGVAPPVRLWRLPAWGLAAAAVLVLAAGAAIANLDVRYGADGLAVRTGWNHDGGAARSVESAAAVANVDWKAQAEQLDRRLRGLEQTLAAGAGTPVRDASASGMSDAELLQHVREMLGQSESRQQRVLAARIDQITREFDAQRRVDLAAVDQGMARLQNSSGAEVKQYRDLIQRMYRATSYQQK